MRARDRAPYPSRRRFAPPQDEAEPSIPISPHRTTHTSSLPRRVVLRPGFAPLLRSPELRGSEAPRDVRVFARHPLDVPWCVEDAAHQRSSCGLAPVAASPRVTSAQCLGLRESGRSDQASLFDHLVGRYSRNGALWNIGPVAVSLRLDVGRPDHLTPFLGFLSHQLSEFGWRHRHGLAGKLRQTGLQLRIGQYRVHRLI